MNDKPVNKKSTDKKSMKRKIVTLVIMMAILTVLVIWIVWGNLTVGITHYKVRSDKLPKSFVGYKIAVVSDLHNAEFGKNNNKLLDIIKTQKPDIIAITGDLVDSSKMDIEVASNLVKELVKIAPCYYVTGNHEAYIEVEGNYKLLKKNLSDVGAIILEDRVELLTKNEETIQIAGLSDPEFSGEGSYSTEGVLWSRINNLELSEDFCVLLSHRPEMFTTYVSQNIDLALCGHAHGGQFRVPFIGGIIAPNQGFFPNLMLVNSLKRAQQ